MSRQRKPTRTTTGHRPDALAQEVLRRRYLRKDRLGRAVETPGKMFRRVAREVAKGDSWCTGSNRKRLEDEYYRLMRDGLFLPNSPTLMNAGRSEGLLSACFVLPIADSIEGIFDAVKQTAMIQKAGGGTGFAFDQLRPTGDLVASSGGHTSGPISFMGVIAAATTSIQQGSFRRGANMGMMSVNHPDIIRFIGAKGTPGALENFNLSVKMTDAFMAALKDRPGQLHVVTNPRDGCEYTIPRGVAMSSYGIRDLAPLKAGAKNPYTVGDVWNLIVSHAHASGEPGLCFIDRINANNPIPAAGRIEATNPCGEQPLPDYESCNLGSINVSKFVLPNGRDLDWDRLGDTIVLAVRFLDNVIDVNHYPLPEIRERTLRGRKIGLGIMGFADALILLGIRYDSHRAVHFARKLGGFLTRTAHNASQGLGERDGRFPDWEGSVWDTAHHRAMRNAACTTIAPTGSISIIAGCSSGIEPIFSLATKRKALDDKEFIAVHPLLEDLGARQGWMNQRVREALLESIHPRKIRGFPDRLAGVLVTAHDVAPEWHVRIQAAFQENIDNAVSKTVNLPASAKVEDVDRIFRMAYDLGCKGITVYRDGSRQGQTLSSAGKKLDAAASGGGSLTPRPRVMPGQTYKHRAGCAPVYVTVNRDEHGLPKEVFAVLGTGGGCPSQSEATCRAVSAALRSGVDPRILIEQLKGIRCASTSVARKSNANIDVLSCPDAIARAIEEAIGETPAEGPQAEPSGRPCPHCRRPMRREAGCFVCDQCQFSSCG